jgi:hypothetical protein
LNVLFTRNVLFTANFAARLRSGTAMLALLLLMGMLVLFGLSLQLKEASPETAQGDAFRQLWYGGTFALLLVGLQFWRAPGRLFDLPLSMWILLGWCAASCLWAFDPGISSRRLILTAMLIWIVFQIVGQLGFDKTARAIRLLLAVALVLNFAAVAFLPSAIHHAGERADPHLIGNWRGLMAHKNAAGPLCAITILSFIFGANNWRPLLRLAIIALACIFLYKTSSETSFRILIVAVVVGAIFYRYSPAYRSLLVPLVMIVGCGVTLLLDTYWPALVRPIGGADPTVLTGRVVIWSMMLDYFRDHPMGAGFSSFWNVGVNGPSYQYSNSWVTTLGSGHSGYLDLLVTIGWIGLLLAVFALFVIPTARLLASQVVGRAQGAWLTSVIMFAAGHNLTESSALDRDSLLNIFLIMAIALSRQRIRERNALIPPRTKARRNVRYRSTRLPETQR